MTFRCSFYLCLSRDINKNVFYWKKIAKIPLSVIKEPEVYKIIEIHVLSFVSICWCLASRESTATSEAEEKFWIADHTLHVEPYHGQDDQKRLIKHLNGEKLILKFSLFYFFLLQKWKEMENSIKCFWCPP